MRLSQSTLPRRNSVLNLDDYRDVAYSTVASAYLHQSPFTVHGYEAPYLEASQPQNRLNVILR